MATMTTGLLSPEPITEKQAAARRENGKKGGRPKGSKSRLTIIVEAARRRLEATIAAKAEELVAAQMAIARMGPDSPGAANAACENLLDRAFGRPTVYTNLTPEVPRDPVTIVYVFAPGTGPETQQVIDVPASPGPKTLPS